MDRKKRSAGALAGALVLAGSALVASAAEGDIEYRQSVYSSIGGHMSAMGAILKQEVPHTVDLAVHAEGIADLAPLTMHLFPEGSGDGRTKAKAAIWENADDFAEKRQNFIDAAAALGDVAGADMGTFAEAFRELGGTCKACHDDYKAD